MPTDPLSRVASWIALANTESEAASLSPANSEPNEERRATPEELAAIEFEAFDAKACQLLYKGMTVKETIMFRLASGYLAKSKPDLVDTIRKLVSDKEGQEAFFEFADGLLAAQKVVEDFAKCLCNAHIRLLIVGAVIGFGEPDTPPAA